MADNIILYYFISFFRVEGISEKISFCLRKMRRELLSVFGGFSFLIATFPFLFRHYFTRRETREGEEISPEDGEAA